MLKIVTDTISAAITKAYTDKELQKSEEMFRSISENAFDLITLIDLKGKFIYCNNSYSYILGYEPDQLLGTYAFDLIHPAEKNKAFQLFQEGIESKLDYAAHLLRLICKDGSYKWVEHRVKQLFTEDNQPDKILFKPGKLNDEEWEIMKMHSEKGYRIALSSHELSTIANFILKHHERWDGKGYPLGLKGEEIPLLCRILAIVDAFDAMTHDRPYQKAVSDAEALIELKRCAGEQFDPHLVNQFILLQETAK